MSTLSKAKAALHRCFNGNADNSGYTRLPQENLVPGVTLETVEDDLRRGDGDELRMKFCAVHSSAALAVNCFGPFKSDPGRLRILGRDSARSVEFERQLRIFRGGRAPNLDVWIERTDDCLGVESKLLEYLTLTQPVVSQAYERLAPPVSDESWWAVYQDAKQGVRQHLDRAQLIKHYFGLKRRKAQNPAQELILLYLFWEPTNWQEVPECIRHMKELESFAEAIGVSQIHFEWMTYGKLWLDWSTSPDLRAHAEELCRRYQVSL